MQLDRWEPTSIDTLSCRMKDGNSGTSIALRVPGIDTVAGSA
jgi:hypothetical protein